jgi:heme exporter protein B
MTAFFRVVWLVVRKDIAVEIRTWELVSTTVFFAFACLLVFSFAFMVEGAVAADLSAGILWIAIAFSGTLALGRTFERERQTETLRALMLAPADRPAIYVGKLGGILLLMALTELLLLPLVALFFQAPVTRAPLLLITLVAAGTIGYAAVGTLFAAMLVRARSRDVLLPVLLYPITIPVIIAGVRGTAALFQTTPDEPLARFWLALLVFFDVAFVTLSLWTFEPLMTE